MSFQDLIELDTHTKAKKRKLSSDEAKWTDHQIEMLIAMWKEPDVLEAIRQPKPVYVLLANRLNDVWGNIECPDRHIWDPDMVKHKIKNLRQQYLEIEEELRVKTQQKQNENVNEDVAILSSWPYFGDLHEILSVLPSKPKPHESYSPPNSGGETEDTSAVPVVPISIYMSPPVSHHHVNTMANPSKDSFNADMEDANDKQPVRKHGNRQESQDDDDDDDGMEDNDEVEDLSRSKGQIRATNWSDDEIRTLVSIWQEPEIANAIAVPTTRFKEVYQDITNRINQVHKTHYRDCVQVKHRVKYTKMMHKKLSDKVKQDPSFDPTEEMICYHEIGEILSRKVTIPAPKEPADKDKDRVSSKKSTLKAQHQRLIAWTDKEVRALLSIWKEPMVAEKIAAKNNEAYRDIAIRLNDIWGMLGRRVDAKDVKQKILLLKKTYYRQTYGSKDEAKGGGDSSVLKQALMWPYYQEVDEILRRVPESQTESDVVEEELEDESISIGKKRSNYPKNRAKNWTNKEVRFLLSIWKEPKIAFKVAEVTTKPKKVFWVMANRINKFWGDSKDHRNEHQIKFKVKDLKMTYKHLTTELENKKPDDPNPTDMWPFYDEMHEILSLDFTDRTFSDLEDEGFDGDGYHRRPKTERAPRVCWEEEHIKLLLSIWKDPYICLQVGEPTTKYKAVYEDITERLDGLSGSVYTIKQVRDKVKELRATYKKVLKKMEEGGKEDGEEPWPHLDAVREIMALEQQLLAEKAAGGRKETMREKILKKKFQHKKQRAVWKHKEVKTLLSICKDPIINQKLFEVTTRHKVVYKTIADLLNQKLMIQRTEKQVRDKINEMKISYRSMAAKLGPAEASSRIDESADDGDEDEDEDDIDDGHWPYYRDMEEIMTGNVTSSLPMTSTPKKQNSSSTHRFKEKTINKSSNREQRGDCDGVDEQSHMMDISIDSSGRDIRAKRSRATNWTNKEMQHLLLIWKNPDISSRIANITTKPKGVYQEMAELYNEGIEQAFSAMIKSIQFDMSYYCVVQCDEITECGDFAPRSVAQIRWKLQDMKEMYRKVCNRLQELQESGERSHVDPSSIWCFYQDVHDILTRDEELSSLLAPVPTTSRTDEEEGENDNDDYDGNVDDIDDDDNDEDDAVDDDDDDDSDWSTSNLTTNEREDVMSSTKYKASIIRRQDKRWSDKETKILLAIWKEPAVMNAIISKKLNVYQLINKKMENAFKGTKHMIMRDSYEMQLKMNALKRQYNAAVAGGSKMTRRWPFFQDMEEIMNHVPSGRFKEQLFTKEGRGKQSNQPRTRSANWSDREVTKLLAIWKKPRVWNAIYDPSTGKKKIYREIANKINRSGVGEEHRNEEQTHYRVQTMKRMYHKMNQKAENPGDASTKSKLAKQWMHYKDMDEIMRRVPGSVKVEDVDMESASDGDETWEDEMDDTLETESNYTKSRQPRKRSANWSDKEVTQLLAIWKEPRVWNAIYDPSTGKKRIYQEIANKINRSGVGEEHRYEEQTHYRVQTMKQMYHKMNRKAGNPGDASTKAKLAKQWMHYKDMDEIMRRKPGSVKVEDVDMESASDGDEMWEAEMDDTLEEESNYTKVRNKRCCWRDANIQVLLSIWKDPAVARQIAQKSTKRKPVYREIQQRLHEICQDSYTVQQIKDKTKEMKQLYRKVAKLKEDDANNVANVLDCNLLAWPYYHDMDDILTEDEKNVSERVLDSTQSGSAKREKQTISTNPTPWSDQETKTLLSIWKKPDILQQLPKRQTNTYKIVTEQLNNIVEGTDFERRNRYEVKRKMEQMERTYKKHAESTSNPSKQWPFYTAMEEIMNSGSDTVEIFFESGVDLCVDDISHNSSTNDDDHTSKVHYSRGTRWSDKETQALISIWEDPEIAQEIGTFTSTKKPVFQTISDRLKKEYQFDRHREQVSSKVRDLRRFYRKLVREGEQKGSISAENWPYFDAMQKILGDDIMVKNPNSKKRPDESDGVSAVGEALHPVLDETSHETSPNSSTYDEDSPSKTRLRSKRWCDEEVQALLSMWEEPEIADEIATFSCTYKPVFQHIADRMKAQHGYDRHREQVSSKVRDMRKLYRALLEEGQKGQTSAETWPYFGAMQKILGDDTIVKKTGSELEVNKASSEMETLKGRCETDLDSEICAMDLAKNATDLRKLTSESDLNKHTSEADFVQERSEAELVGETSRTEFAKAREMDSVEEASGMDSVKAMGGTDMVDETK